MHSGKKILISLLALSLLLLFFWFTTIKFFCSESENKSTYEHETKSDSSITNSVPFKDTTPFITYWNLSNSQQIPYKTKKLTSAKVKLLVTFFFESVLFKRELVSDGTDVTVSLLFNSGRLYLEPRVNPLVFTIPLGLRI